MSVTTVLSIKSSESIRAYLRSPSPALADLGSTDSSHFERDDWPNFRGCRDLVTIVEESLGMIGEWQVVYAARV